MKAPGSRAAAAGLIVAVLLGGCQKQAAKRAATAEGPKIRATVVTIRTTMQPANRTFWHSVIIANDRARTGDEVDVWRLVDTRAQKIITVDDVAKTQRTDPIAKFLKERRDRAKAPVAEGTPHLAAVRTGDRQVMQGVQATRVALRAGSYARDLWIGTHPLIPEQLFGLLEASKPDDSAFAAITRTADESLFSAKGYPLLDVSTLTWGDQKLAVEHRVMKVEQKDVPEAWLKVPDGYRDVTPKPASEKK